jgi:type I restriction enzyme S subunit
MMEEDAVPNIDINPNDWVEIRRILRTCVPEYEVWGFGSRAKWTAKPYSDLDLAILTDKPLSLEKAAELRSALDESTIPIKVDVVDWAATSESFRKIIEAGKVVVLRPAKGLSGWAFKRLIDCTVDGVLSYGIVQPGQHDERGVPIVRVNNISTGQLHVEEPLRVAPEIEANYQRTRLEGGEVLLTVVGTTGQSAIVPKELAGWNVARAVAVIRPKPEIGGRWIHICLQSKAVQQFLDERANTTVQKTLNLSDIKEVLIPIPPPSVKELIESIAVGLDDKIELNRRMNATLEAMARALFQSWFVDFDPVRAKLDGRPPAALDRATVSLFPDCFHDSELGLIPKGWTAGKLGDVGMNSRRGVKPAEIAPNTPYIALEHMPRRCIALGDWDDSVDVASGKSAFKEGEILFGKLRPYFHKVGVAPLDGVCSTDILVIAPKVPDWFGFLLGHTSSDELIQFTDLASTGTKMPRTSWRDISSFKVAVPPQPIAAAFTRSIQPMLDRIHANLHQSRTLAGMRDTLLPRLLEGTVKVAPGS